MIQAQVNHPGKRRGLTSLRVIIAPTDQFAERDVSPAAKLRAPLSEALARDGIKITCHHPAARSRRQPLDALDEPPWV